jgi:hypothetical protein
VTLAVAIFALGPIVHWKTAVGAALYLALLVVIHVFALVVFLRRVPWRHLAAHKGASPSASRGCSSSSCSSAPCRSKAARPGPGPP